MKELSSIPFQAQEGPGPQCPLAVTALSRGDNAEQWGLSVPALSLAPRLHLTQGTLRRLRAFRHNYLNHRD